MYQGLSKRANARHLFDSVAAVRGSYRRSADRHRQVQRQTDRRRRRDPVETALSGASSRRIDHEHGLVRAIDGDYLVIVQTRRHDQCISPSSTS
ncbi:type II toxin-antitoxin system YoeB family toxin [Rhodococcus sp. 27YEA15]|uniref:type II toxin-antitoxin system YoeB family toxin n=1 Tax=Rhodococcus sp. 27YEA15 TaxID=3156259 RepID=UPI003C7E9FA7